ncbi:MAG: SIR2 family NAD-dependent protein deacylase [Deltaproteobacteria bacterium]
MSGDIQRAKELIKNAKSVAVLTGAGISAESGIPTFRGERGLWEKYRPEDVDTQDAFRRNPAYVWEWYGSIRELVAKSKPNAGHLALVELERMKGNFGIITQNIDDLHRAAGSRNVIELHGNVWRPRCAVCLEIEENREVPLAESPPKCRKCGGMLRPGVIWYDENIPAEIIDASLIAIETCDVMVIIGTSALVEPAGSMGLVAKRIGKPVIEINLERTMNSVFYDVILLGKSGDILPEIILG